MKLFLRGLFALGLSAALAATALCDTPKTAAPTATAAPAACPAPAAPAPAAAAPTSGCATGGVVRGHGRHAGRFGFGSRIDGAVERYVGFNDRLGGCLAKLAGPPADVSGGISGKQKGGPNTQPGTLVFPQHPFARSPRDFFMQD